MAKHILYLASGSGRRFGSNKLLYEIGGKPMYLYGLEMLLEAAGDWEITVVSRYETIRQRAQVMGLKAVDSPESEKGISCTIRAGIQSLGAVPKEDFLVFFVADQPYLTAATMKKLLGLAVPGTECACVCWKDRPGNPALFSASLIPELMALEGDRGGRAVIKNHSCRYVEACSQQELEDIDTK